MDMTSNLNNPTANQSAVVVKNDFYIDIATGGSCFAKKWKNDKWSLSDFVKKCSETKRTKETAEEYAKMNHDMQGKIKDVGGFVGGCLKDGIRRKANVLCRSMITLDADYGTPDVWEKIQKEFKCAVVVYSTHKHTQEKPRYRVIMFLNRSVTCEEYEAIARKVAEIIGIDTFDDTTYDPSRLFYWPSTSKDAEFFFRFQDGTQLDADSILKKYENWKDRSEWPHSSRTDEVIQREVKTQADPTKKRGWVGAFCIAYPIKDAIDKYLTDDYKPERGDRYTYIKGSTSNGLACYGKYFAYSNQTSDPTCGMLCNSYDLVRKHLFGTRDEGIRVKDPTRLPSYLAMINLISNDPKVLDALKEIRDKSAQDDFEGIELPEGYTGDWERDLDKDTKSARVLSTRSNVVAILENHYAFKDHLKYDEFARKDIVVDGLPWNADAKSWGDRDYSNLRTWLENHYSIVGKDTVHDAFESVLTAHRFHPVRDYFNSLKWDGTPRLDRLVINYLGAEDSELNRAMTRKHFVAAVARVFKPGCKYDQCLILSGPEGTGKSSLFSIMAGPWFSDSFTTMDGKEAMEQLCNVLMIEMAELSSMKRSDVEQVKAFISKQFDKYRPAYRENEVIYERQCVFCATTNEEFYMKGDTGNRRFWPIKVVPALRKNENFRECIAKDRDQLWAEAVHFYKEGEDLFLTPELEKQARTRQAECNDDSDDPMRTRLDWFLDKKLPSGWEKKSIQDRHRYWMDPDPLQENGGKRRDLFCSVEFVDEVLGIDEASKDRKYTIRKINSFMRSKPDWEEVSRTDHLIDVYGKKLRGFKRVGPETEIADDDDVI